MCPTIANPTPSKCSLQYYFFQPHRKSSGGLPLSADLIFSPAIRDKRSKTERLCGPIYVISGGGVRAVSSEAAAQTASDSMEGSVTTGQTAWRGTCTVRNCLPPAVEM